MIAKSPWIPNRPTKKQLLFLALPDREALYGGQVGGGKSDALLMGALMYADVPGYNAIIFRRTYPELSQAEGLLSRAKEWLGPTRAKWNEQENKWTFPSGATLRFGHMQNKTDFHKYQGGAYQYIGYDELTGFEEAQYTYLLSRLRRLRKSPVPLRQRGASNPGNTGHQWVFERFVADDPMGVGRGLRPFISASLDDNPHLSTEEYRENLLELDDVTREQLLRGRWILPQGRKPFNREWWKNRRNRYDPDSNLYQTKALARWISWDTAEKDEEENAYTACCVGELFEDRLLIREVWRDRLLLPELVDAIEYYAKKYNKDGKLETIIIEDKSSGTGAYQTLLNSGSRMVRERLLAWQPSGDKESRWSQAAVWAKRDCIWLPLAKPSVSHWRYAFEKELFDVPDSAFKDQVDAFSQLVIYLEHILADGYIARNPDLLAA